MVLNLPRLTAPNFYAVHPSTGRPVSAGTVWFYAPGTTSLKVAYLDRAGESPAPNPVTLGPAGEAEVYLSGAYRIEVRDANGAFLYARDYVNSIPVELEEGNPGSLLISENLADLADKGEARAVLSLVKQVDTKDMTAGRVMLNGGLGYGGDAVAVPGTLTATNFNTLVTPGVFAVENPGTLTNPPGTTVAGILEVIRSAADRVVQRFTTAGAGAGNNTWSRALSGAGWSAWTEAYSQKTLVGTVAGTGDAPTGAALERLAAAGGSYHLDATGRLVCLSGPLTFAYTGPGSIGVTWTFPKAFGGALPVWISECQFPSSGAQYSGSNMTGGSIGKLVTSHTATPTTSIALAFLKTEGAPNWGNDAQVQNVRLRAEGWAF